MSGACTTNKYEELYARWIPGAGKLLDIGNFQPGDRLLDLCGGSGAVSKEALLRIAYWPTIWPLGKRVTLLDLNPRYHHRSLTEVKGDALQIRRFFGRGTFDLVVCRQAIAYFDIEDLPLLFEHIAETLSPGGRFVFNNFKKPRWFAKFYRYDGRTYFEAAGHLGDTVYHLQASPRLGIDATVFYWHPHDELLPLLKRHFEVSVIESKSSIRYLCLLTRKR